jgi:hypothetical protein
MSLTDHDIPVLVLLRSRLKQSSLRKAVDYALHAIQVPIKIIADVILDLCPWSIQALFLDLLAVASFHFCVIGLALIHTKIPILTYCLAGVAVLLCVIWEFHNRSRRSKIRSKALLPIDAGNYSLQSARGLDSKVALKPLQKPIEDGADSPSKLLKNRYFYRNSWFFYRNHGYVVKGKSAVNTGMDFLKRMTTGNEEEVSFFNPADISDFIVDDEASIGRFFSPQKSVGSPIDREGAPIGKGDAGPGRAVQKSRRNRQQNRNKSSPSKNPNAPFYENENEKDQVGDIFDVTLTGFDATFLDDVTGGNTRQESEDNPDPYPGDSMAGFFDSDLMLKDFDGINEDYLKTADDFVDRFFKVNARKH